ncbi:trypsin-like peptidase domain-containing protein [Clostridium sp. CM028]|uniref:S1C family serine protease n=1 Tax=unclassified Clostridium TaxID=2614128 RepID=UPI001C0E8CDF|nr:MULTISPECIES: trypsin-like peptidase domain-containing protein [unclassified Clostridium]MBU3093894.1 trypsin-like peptidase domain-containing protein [Clostridium sp. CF011]MBW9147197.1 trypsin-like peptidase domain-containing protein [Clostridium sp. CM027]MBW9150350.1 trypsin-like peptidase domain-containing protein [Clostridium sp. CM028]UVE39735.1 trypsin-like peptidase domain-containing protein [Clostridium sp. CM027]WAG68642.1 trypsin-like peptidase domain-containing protein [Clostri
MSDDTNNNETNENIIHSEGVNEKLTVNADNDGYNEKESENTNLKLENINYTEVNNKKVKKNKCGMGKRILSYIIVGIVCSALGGVGSAVVTMNMIKDTRTTGTPATNTPASSNSNVKLTTANSTEELTTPEIVKKVGPAVVAISTNTSSVSKDVRRQDQQQEGVGTGIIFSKDGYILTNYHVVSGAQNIKVMLSDGKEVSAKIINYDATADVAVIKLADNTNVPGVAEFGDSDTLQVGESVVAIGNPLGKELLGSVTKGVVSAVNRQISIENKDLKFIQTDAAINPGNSGGPLVNSKGQVIGINTAKIGQEGVEGLGFSIPINTINPKIESLLKPVLNIGISCRDITEDISKEYNIPVGVYIAQIKEFSAAEKSGMRVEDTIIKFDGKKIKTVEEINKIKGTHKAGDIIKIELVREGKTIKVNLTLSE